MVGAGLKGLFGDRYARVIQLKRRKKQLCALTVGNGAGDAMTSKCAGSATCRWQAGGSIWNTSGRVPSGWAVRETDIDLFFKALGGKKSARIKLAAMDMWKPFRNSVIHNAPNARIIFDKLHIMRHLSKALDEVRRGEYKRLSGKDRSYIKGQRYTLLSRRENLSLDGRRALKKLLQANRRLNTAYILKEAFGQLWDYRTERGARAFFTRWKDSLKWQRLHPYQKFAGMIESHWDGIASYCHPENKVSLGLVEGVNNKIRVLQRRAYGYRDEEYLKLKIVAAFLPPLPRNAVFNPHESA